MKYAMRLTAVTLLISLASCSADPTEGNQISSEGTIVPEKRALIVVINPDSTRTVHPVVYRRFWTKVAELSDAEIVGYYEEINPWLEPGEKACLELSGNFPGSRLRELEREIAATFTPDGWGTIYNIYQVTSCRD